MTNSISPAPISPGGIAQHLKDILAGGGTRSVLAESIGATNGANVIRKLAQSTVVVVEPFSIDPPIAANFGWALWAASIFSHQSSAGRQWSSVQVIILPVEADVPMALKWNTEAPGALIQRTDFRCSGTGSGRPIPLESASRISASIAANWGNRISRHSCELGQGCVVAMTTES